MSEPRRTWSVARRVGLVLGAGVAMTVVGACGSSADGSAPHGADTIAEAASATTTPVTVTATVPASTLPPMPETVFVFAAPDSIEGWRATNDTVMGGVSVGGLSWADGAMVFAGELSLDNNGGFTSVVSPALNAPQWASADGVSLDVIGDGRTYTVQVRSASSGYWIQPFSTQSGTAQRLVLPWSGFEPVSRFLDPIPAPGPLDPADVATMVIYLVDGQEGPFRLSVRALG